MSRPPLLLTERLSGPHYQHNAQTLAFTRTSTSVLAGCVAGVLGLTGLYGFLFYLLSILLSAALWYYRLHFDVKVATAPTRTAPPHRTASIAAGAPRKCLMWTFAALCCAQPYFPHWHHLASDGLMSGLMTYILFWTLLHDIVYIY